MNYPRFTEPDLDPQWRGDGEEDPRCDRCGRTTAAPGAAGTEDRMTQPDGNPCGGRFVLPE